MITGNIISNENSPETRTYNKARIRTIYKTNIKNRDMENETMDRRIEQKKEAGDWHSAARLCLIGEEPCCLHSSCGSYSGTIRPHCASTEIQSLQEKSLPGNSMTISA